MKLKNILIVVKNMERSITFYKELFGLEVIVQNEGNTIMTEGLVLQDAAIWKEYLEKEVTVPNNAAVLYFEEPDMEEFARKLEAYQEPIEYVTPLTELPWGQKVVRLYDLDGNLIEVRD